MAEADDIEVEIEQLFEGAQRLFRILGDSVGRWGEPARELVLERVADDDHALGWQVESDAAGSVSGEVHYSHLRAERDDVAVFESKVDGDVTSHELGENWFGHSGEKLVLERVRGSRFARNDFGVKSMGGHLDPGSLDQLCESAAVVGVGVGNCDSVHVVWSESQVFEAAGNWEKTSLKSCID